MVKRSSARLPYDWLRAAWTVAVAAAAAWVMWRLATGAGAPAPRVRGAAALPALLAPLTLALFRIPDRWLPPGAAASLLGKWVRLVATPGLILLVSPGLRGAGWLAGPGAQAAAGLQAATPGEILLTTAVLAAYLAGCAALVAVKSRWREV